MLYNYRMPVEFVLQIILDIFVSESCYGVNNTKWQNYAERKNQGSLVQDSRCLVIQSDDRTFSLLFVQLQGVAFEDFGLTGDLGACILKCIWAE